MEVQLVRLLLPVVGRKLSEGSSHSVLTNDSGFVRIVLPKVGCHNINVPKYFHLPGSNVHVAHVLETLKT